MECPYCHELFPKNDFKAFYDSGLNEQGLFTYEYANHDLLFNSEDNSTFAVDDGNGYKDENGTIWWFIVNLPLYMVNGGG